MQAHLRANISMVCYCLVCSLHNAVNKECGLWWSSEGEPYSFTSPFPITSILSEFKMVSILQ